MSTTTDTIRWCLDAFDYYYDTYLFPPTYCADYFWYALIGFCILYIPFIIMAEKRSSFTLPCSAMLMWFSVILFNHPPFVAAATVVVEYGKTYNGTTFSGTGNATYIFNGLSPDSEIRLRIRSWDTLNSFLPDYLNVAFNGPYAKSSFSGTSDTKTEFAATCPFINGETNTSATITWARGDSTNAASVEFELINNVKLDINGAIRSFESCSYSYASAIYYFDVVDSNAGTVYIYGRGGTWNSYSIFAFANMSCDPRDMKSMQAAITANYKNLPPGLVMFGIDFGFSSTDSIILVNPTIGRYFVHLGEGGQGCASGLDAPEAAQIGVCQGLSNCNAIVAATTSGATRNIILSNGGDTNNRLLSSSGGETKIYKYLLTFFEF